MTNPTPPGDKLLVFGDLEHGLALAKASTLLAKMPELTALLEAQKSGAE